MVRGETKAHVAVSISRGTRHAFPFLDPWQHYVDELGQKVIGIFTLHGGGDCNVSALAQTPPDDIVPGLVRYCSDITDGLQHHSGNVQVPAVLLGLWYHRVDDDLCDLGHIAECAGFLEQAQDFTLASRGPQRAVLEVGRVAGPFAQALVCLWGSVAWGVVLICEGEQVGGYLALVRLFEARQAKGPRLEETRSRI